jgi:hypothetical protein
MESAGRGGVLITGSTLGHLTPEQLDELGVLAKRLRRPVFAQRLSGVPSDITMYRLETRRELSGTDTTNGNSPRE